MLKYPVIDPVAIALGPFELFGHTLGPLQVHWYGIMYLIGFGCAWLLALHRAGSPHSPLQRAQVEDMIVWGAMGVVLGGRLGYVFFYHFDRLLQEPAWLLRVWEGGMSFHGGMIGVILAMALYAWKIKVPFFRLMDFVAPLAPLGLGFGRLGNFIGQELWGRATDVSWGMIFPRDPLGLVRHPSQLYQAALEGLVLFLVLYWFSSKPRPRMAVSGLFLLLYGSFRFAVEFVREPDSHLGLDALGWMTRGQELSLPMIVLGAVLLVLAYRRAGKEGQVAPAGVNGEGKA